MLWGTPKLTIRACGEPRKDQYHALTQANPGERLHSAFQRGASHPEPRRLLAIPHIIERDTDCADV
jgi:hypothetical protein